MKAPSHKEAYYPHPMSLLTLQLAEQREDDAIIPTRPSSTQISEKDNEVDDGQAYDPPMRVDAERKFLRIPLEDGESSVRARGSRSGSNNLYSGSSQRISTSPLTARSYTTMSKEYDMDTWRMYNRIQDARSERSKSYLPSIENDHSDHDTEPSEASWLQTVHDSIALISDEDIFDLEL